LISFKGTTKLPLMVLFQNKAMLLACSILKLSVLCLAPIEQERYTTNPISLGVAMKVVHVVWLLGWSWTSYYSRHRGSVRCAKRILCDPIFRCSRNIQYFCFSKWHRPDREFGVLSFATWLKQTGKEPYWVCSIMASVGIYIYGTGTFRLPFSYWAEPVDPTNCSNFTSCSDCREVVYCKWCEDSKVCRWTDWFSWLSFVEFSLSVD